MCILTPANVESMFKTCLFKDEEITGGVPCEPPVISESVMVKAGFHPGRIRENADAIKAMLSELPGNFMKSGGGGWSFLNACKTKDGVLWTGDHRTMDLLFALGIAIGAVTFPMPRNMWECFPGGMPYIQVDLS